MKRERRLTSTAADAQRLPWRGVAGLVVVEEVGKPTTQKMSLVHLRHKLEKLDVFKG